MREAAPSLFHEVRNYLDITWQDCEGDKKLEGIIARGMAYLRGVAGGALDFEAEEKPKELLLEYCRYVRAGALDEFQGNYLPELLSLQIDAEVRRRDQKPDEETSV